MTDETIIKVDHVTKIYNLYDSPMDRLKEALGLGRKSRSKKHYALNDLSFEVKRGETVGIIGTNGSGKSTILKIITGVLAATEGEVTVNGRISALLELGAGFNMEYTGIENIYLNGSMIGFTREEIEQRIPEILKFADIGDFVYQPVKTYSSGMFVRLAFAVAINIEPEILIVDEALSVGDVFFQSKCYHKFEEFKEKGKTILFVSHDLSSVSKYCDRVILLNNGVKLDEGSARDMVDRFKKVMVHQDEELDNHVTEPQTLPESTQGKRWKDSLTINPNIQVYGNGMADIIDFACIDSEGKINTAIFKDSDFTIKMKVHFNETVERPIFALTFKDLKGTDITGTNTMFSHVDVPVCTAGKEVEITFKQNMNLVGGTYLVSFGCTGYIDDEFVVYQRQYDAFNITVISYKNVVGFYDMNNEITVEEVL